MIVLLMMIEELLAMQLVAMLEEHNTTAGL